MVADGQWLAADRRLEADLTALAQRLDEAGHADEARALRERVSAWLAARQPALDELHQTLGVHHEINNALVGVSGNAQLLLLGPAVEQPGVRERVQVILREATRIKEAATRLRELRAALGPGDSHRRAA
jgi:nitrogen-specific signal transduction histidine kinase